jgi:hypothetical protein
MCGLEKAHSAIGGEAKLLGPQHESLLIDLAWTHPDECGNRVNVIPQAYEVKSSCASTNAVMKASSRHDS